MRINTNVSAIVSNNALQKAQDALSSSIQRLSSGYKINSSADDPNPNFRVCKSFHY